MNRSFFNAVLALFAVLFTACSTPVPLDTASLASSTILRFDVRQGGWDVASMAAVEVGDEWRQGDDVFRRIEAGDVYVGSITVGALAKADQTWSGVPSVPASNGWVRTFGDEVRHVRLNELKPGAQFVYGGRIFETRGVDAVEGIRATGEVIERVLNTSSRIAPGVIDAVVLHADGTTETLTATPEHPFYVPELGDYVDLGSLALGTVLLESGGGEARLLSKEWRDEPVEVFNFGVARTHNYFVRIAGGESAGTLVHNSGPAGGPCGSVASKGAGTIDDMSRAAGAADKGGMTKAGRAAQKHGDRVDSAFPKATGNVAKKNAAGQDIVDDILTDPSSTSTSFTHGRFGDVTDVVAGDGRGVRFGADGNMIGLLEPPK